MPDCSRSQPALRHEQGIMMGSIAAKRASARICVPSRSSWRESEARGQDFRALVEKLVS